MSRARAASSAPAATTAVPRNNAAHRWSAAPIRSAMNARPPVPIARSANAAIRTRLPATRTTAASLQRAEAEAARIAPMSVRRSRASRAVRGSMRNKGAASSIGGSTAIRATRVKPRSASAARSASAGECRRTGRRFACRNDTGGAIVDRHMSQEMTIHSISPELRVCGSTPLQARETPVSQRSPKQSPVWAHGV